MKDLLISVCLVLVAFALGMMCEAHEAKKKPRDHRQPFRYWRP